MSRANCWWGVRWPARSDSAIAQEMARAVRKILVFMNHLIVTRLAACWVNHAPIHDRELDSGGFDLGLGNLEDVFAENDEVGEFADRESAFGLVGEFQLHGRPHGGFSACIFQQLIRLIVCGEQGFEARAQGSI